MNSIRYAFAMARIMLGKKLVPAITSLIETQKIKARFLRWTFAEKSS